MAQPRATRGSSSPCSLICFYHGFLFWSSCTEFVYSGITWFHLSLTCTLLRILISGIALIPLGARLCPAGQQDVPSSFLLDSASQRSTSGSSASRSSLNTGYGILKIFDIIHALKGLVIWLESGPPHTEI